MPATDAIHEDVKIVTDRERDTKDMPCEQSAEEVDGVDAASSDSFPASDAPPWTMGIDPPANGPC